MVVVFVFVVGFLVVGDGRSCQPFPPFPPRPRTHQLSVGDPSALQPALELAAGAAGRLFCVCVCVREGRTVVDDEKGCRERWREKTGGRVACVCAPFPPSRPPSPAVRLTLASALSAPNSTSNSANTAHSRAAAGRAICLVERKSFPPLAKEGEK